MIADCAVMTDTLITPSVLATVDPGACGSLRRLTTGGERMGRSWWHGSPGCPGSDVQPLRPVGGDGVCHRGPVVSGEPVTIGRPIDGFTVRVLDARLHPVPRGVAGRLYLSGAGLRARYLGTAGADRRSVCG